MNGCTRRLPTYPFARNQTSVVQGQDANDMHEDFDYWTYTLREAGLYSKQCNVLTSTGEVRKIARENACKMQVRCTKQCDAMN